MEIGENMASIVIDLDEEDYNDLMDIYEINLNYLSEEAVNILEWTSFESFVMDLIKYGVSTASDDPVAFVRSMVDDKMPLFRKVEDKEKDDKKKKFEEEVKKAYT